MATPYLSDYLDPAKPCKDEDEEDPTLRPRNSVASLFLPIEETDSPYKEKIITLPKHKSLPPFIMRQYQGFWQWEGLLPGIFDVQQHFVSRADDIFIASLPKCGTTWLKALTFATVNRSKYSFTSHPLLRLNPHDCVRFIEEYFREKEYIDALPSPRVLAFHIPYSGLPHTITSSGCKIVYVGREPKDVLVSLWHMCKNMVPEMSIPFNQTFDLFCEGKGAVGPSWDHMLEYWDESVRRPDKVLFLKYEEMIDDTGGTLKRLADFIGCPFSEEEEKEGVMEKITNLCSLKRLKDLDVNKKTEPNGTIDGNTMFFRRGVVGDWRNHMTPEMTEKLDNITKLKFQGSGLTFSNLA